MVYVEYILIKHTCMDKLLLRMKWIEILNLQKLLDPYSLDANKSDYLDMSFKLSIDDKKVNCQAEHGEDNFL